MAPFSHESNSLLTCLSHQSAMLCWISKPQSSSLKLITLLLMGPSFMLHYFCILKSIEVLWWQHEREDASWYVQCWNSKPTVVKYTAWCKTSTSLKCWSVVVSGAATNSEGQIPSVHFCARSWQRLRTFGGPDPREERMALHPRPKEDGHHCRGLRAAMTALNSELPRFKSETAQYPEPCVWECSDTEGFKLLN